MQLHGYDWAPRVIIVFVQPQLLLCSYNSNVLTHLEGFTKFTQLHVLDVINCNLAHCARESKLELDPD